MDAGHKTLYKGITMNQFETYFDEVNFFFRGKEHEHINTCYLCGEQQELTFKRIYGLLYQCHKCKFVWLATQPKQEALNEFYAQSEAMNTWANIKSGGTDDVRQNAKYDMFWKFIADEDLDCVLDVGCGTGYFLDHLPRGVGGVGIEINSDSLKHCSTEIAESLDNIHQYFDMITMFGILEHFKDPRKELEKYAKYHQPGGYLGVIVPNIDSLAFQILGEQNCTICPQHLWYYNIDTLSRLLGSVGYELVTYKTAETEYQPICRKLLGVHPYNKLGGLELEHPIIREQNILPRNLGAKITAIFRKVKVNVKESTDVVKTHSDHTGPSGIKVDN